LPLQKLLHEKSTNISDKISDREIRLTEAKIHQTDDSNGRQKRDEREYKGSTKT